MATPSCPSCQSEPRPLEHINAHAHVDYFRCDRCGTVFTMPKAQPGARPTVVTSGAAPMQES